MRWTAALALSILLTAPGGEGRCLAQRPSGQPPDYLKAFLSRQDEGTLTRVILRNGLTVLIEEHPLDPLAAVVTHVGAGRAHEDADTAGASRLLEKLWIHGGSAAEEARRLGATIEVHTRPRATVISSIGAAQNLLKLLEVHARLLQTPVFDREAVQREAGLILQLQRRSTSSPWKTSRNRLLERIFPGAEGFGLEPAALEPPNVEELIRKVRRFHANGYGSGNVILSLSGHLRRERVLEEVVRLYARSSQAGSDDRRESRPATGETVSFEPTGFQYLHQRAALEKAHLALGYRLPAVDATLRQNLELLAGLLDPENRGLLSAAVPLRLPDGIPRMEILEGPREGVVLWALRVPARQVDAALVAILSRMEVLRREGVSAGQLDRVKSLWLKDYYKELQHLDRRAQELARHEVLGDFRGRDRLPAGLERIQGRDIRRLLERYFQTSNLTLLETLPLEAEPRVFTPQTLHETLELLVEAEVRRRAGEIRSAPGEEKSAFRAPDFKPSYVRQAIRRTSILRGPTVYFQERRPVPLVHLGFFFPGGRLQESPQNSGITEIMLRALVAEFTGATPSGESVLEQWGGEIEAVNEPDFFGFRITLLSRHLEEALRPLLDWIRNPVIDQHSFLQQRDALRRQLEARAKGGMSELVQKAREQIYPDHPYRLPRSGTDTSLDELTLPAVQEWISAQMKGVHPLIAVRGDIEGTSFLRPFVSELSDSRYKARGIPPADSLKPLREPVQQSADGRVLIGFQGPPRGSRESAVLTILPRLLAGPAGCLAASLGDWKGRGGRVRVFFESRSKGGAIFATAWGGPERALLEALYGEFKRMRNIPPRESEFLPAVVGAITDFYIRQQAGEAYLVELAGHWMMEPEGDPEETFLARVKNAGRNDLQALARRYFVFEEGEAIP